MDWKTWLKGLIAAIINGAATGVSTYIVAPDQFNLEEGFSKLFTVIVISAIFGAALYLKQSPLPE